MERKAVFGQHSAPDTKSFSYVCCTVTVTLTITIYDVFYVYHDGDIVLTADDWRFDHTVSLDDACVLAIKAVDTGDGDGAAILVSTSTGVVTDASWKCSGGAVEQTGWHLPGFDDAAWSQAQVIAANDGSFWMGVLPEISPAAQWIWSQNSDDDVVFCRKRLC